MIDDPPLITLRRKVPRPTAAQLAALDGTPTGFVVDALGGRGALAADIKPVVAEQASFCGVAVPCHVGPSDNLAILAALPLLQSGDVVVAAADGFRDTALTGDLLLGMAKNQGAVGFVTDGCARDIAGIREVGLPCFSAGVTPSSCVRSGPGTINLPVVVGGVHVGPGDIVIADSDGVVVIPFARIDAVIERLAAVRAAEADLFAKVQGGLGVPDWVRELLASDRTREVE